MIDSPKFGGNYRVAPEVRVLGHILIDALKGRSKPWWGETVGTTLRAFAIAAAHGLALAGGAAALRPSAAVAASDLYALTLQSGGTFGSVDLATGDFTPIGPGLGGLGPGYYAPVFDPATNAFFATSLSLGSASFSNQIVRIDATTGAVSNLVLNNPSSIFNSAFVEGLGVDSTTGTLYALTLQLGGTFGSVDLATGDFTPIGPGLGGLGLGYYAPVFDPAANAFFVTSLPLGDPSFSQQIVRFDATTGAATDLVLNNPSSIFNEPDVEGLGVASGPLAAVPELSTWTMMVVGFVGLGFVACRRWPNKRRLSGPQMS